MFARDVNSNNIHDSIESKLVNLSWHLTQKSEEAQNVARDRLDLQR